MTISAIDLSHVYARKILARRCSTLRLVQVGCGGIGGFLANSTARLARAGRRQYRKVEILFIDPDQVEEKNITRQNFCHAEIGQNKAEALAFRLNTAWGMDIHALPKAFTRHTLSWSDSDTLTILLGAVDNAKARQALHAHLDSDQGRHEDGSPIWLLDGGNFSTHGQVCLGNTTAPDLLVKSFELPGLCKNLPSPALVHPELLIPQPDEHVTKKRSCADLALDDPQSLTINAIIAAHMADYLLRLTLTHDLRRFATYIDTNTASMRSLAATPEQVRQALHHLPDLSQALLRHHT